MLNMSEPASGCVRCVALEENHALCVLDDELLAADDELFREEGQTANKLICKN